MRRLQVLYTPPKMKFSRVRQILERLIQRLRLVSTRNNRLRYRIRAPYHRRHLIRWGGRRYPECSFQR